eukprot:scaffold3758_cov162-Isochrysis_galbana.AAC.1
MREGGTWCRHGQGQVSTAPAKSMHGAARLDVPVQAHRRVGSAGAMQLDDIVSSCRRHGNAQSHHAHRRCGICSETSGPDDK